MTRVTSWPAGAFIAALLALTMAPSSAAGLPQDTIPTRVLDAVKARFPGAEVEKWDKEEEGGFVVYDIEFAQAGKHCEADVREDGTIVNWEVEIGIDELPAAVKDSVAAKYPGSTIEQIMEVTEAADGSEALEGYEVIMLTAEKKKIEVTLAPDGRVLEEPGEEG